MTQSNKKLGANDWQQIKMLIDACAPLTPTQREKFLDESMVSPEIKIEVLSMLDSQSTQSVFEKNTTSEIGRMSVIRTETQFVPRVVNKYLLLKHLGRGGMAEVFLARSEGAGQFEKLFAIKQIRAEYASNQDFKSLIEFEARLSTRLTHSNIIQVYDFIHDKGTPMLVMEYVSGKTLSQILKNLHLKNEKFTVEQATHITNEVAKALEFAHTAKDDNSQEPLNIIHRDISSSNIMISYYGNVKVLDFGIAKAKDRADITKSGQVRVTVRYCAPEIIDGLEASQRSDLFSLGVVYYEMLSGTPIFQSEITTYLLQTKNQDYITEKISKLVLDSDLKSILFKMLSIQPENRYLSALELRKDLHELLHKMHSLDESKGLAQLVQALFNREYRNEQIELSSPQTRELDQIIQGVEKNKKIKPISVIGMLLILMVGIFGLYNVFSYNKPKPVRIVSKKQVIEKIENLPRKVSSIPTQCSFTVKSKPNGAKVLIDGEKKGITPADLKGACGDPVMLELKMTNYQSFKQPFTPKKDKEAHLFSLKKKKKKGNK